MRLAPSTAANLANLPLPFVGVSLLAIAVVQSQMLCLTCRHRQQAGPQVDCISSRFERAPPTFRDAPGLRRRRCIESLEYFYRLGLTRHIGESRQIRYDNALANANAP